MVENNKLVEFAKGAEARKLAFDPDRLKKDFRTQQECRSFLINERKSLLEEINMSKKGSPARSLSPLFISQSLLNHFHVAILNPNEGARISIYLPWEGIYTSNYDKIKKVIHWIEVSADEPKAEKAIYFTKMEVEYTEPTTSKTLIPVGNGIFNTETGKLIPFSPKYIFNTKVMTNYRPFDHEPDIDGWTLSSWINDISNHDPQQAELLWQIINDACNGNYSRKKSFILTGSRNGNNGKGTYQQLIKNIVGAGNYASLKIAEFAGRFELKQLEGKSVCIGDDNPTKVVINDHSNYNSVVTGDPVKIEGKGKDTYPTELKCTVIQSLNGTPRFKDLGGVLRRLIFVPFTKEFSDTDEKADIKEDYLKRPEILEYALYKALNMKFTKFTIPESSMKIAKEFKDETDPLEVFANEVFFTADSDEGFNYEKIPTKYAYEHYVKFCEDNGFTRQNINNFTRSLVMILKDTYEKKTVRYSAEDIQAIEKKDHRPGLEDYSVNNKTKILPKKLYRSLILIKEESN